MKAILYRTMTAIFLFVWLIVFLCAVRTWQVERSPNQARFQQGNATTPDGFYAGTVPGHTVSWLGKKFDTAHHSGINLFAQQDGSTRERYPFKTALQKGVVNPQLSVIGIDYNLKENPFWLRPVLDEIVEVAPGKYLGMLHVRLIPGYPFTLAYFELKK